MRPVIANRFPIPALRDVFGKMAATGQGAFQQKDRFWNCWTLRRDGIISLIGWWNLSNQYQRTLQKGARIISHGEKSRFEKITLKRAPFFPSFDTSDGCGNFSIFLPVVCTHIFHSHTFSQTFVHGIKTRGMPAQMKRRSSIFTSRFTWKRLVWLTTKRFVKLLPYERIGFDTERRQCFGHIQ